MTVTKQWDLIFQALKCSLDIFITVCRKRFFQMICNAVVIHHDSAALAEACAVHPGNSLQQFCFPNRAVEIHDARYGSVEPGQQHRFYDQETEGVGLLWVFVKQWLLESFDILLNLRPITPLSPATVIVVAATEHHGKLKLLK